MEQRIAVISIDTSSILKQDLIVVGFTLHGKCQAE